tara:strand:- start:572 stop:799 length:228 start_codon:yes stop_codon:yes gene_type:complete
MLNVGDIISYKSQMDLPSGHGRPDGLYIVSVAEETWFRAIKPNSECYIVLGFDSLQRFIDKGEIEIITKTDKKCP